METTMYFLILKEENTFQGMTFKENKFQGMTFKELENHNRTLLLYP